MIVINTHLCIVITALATFVLACSFPYENKYILYKCDDDHDNNEYIRRHDWVGMVIHW